MITLSGQSGILAHVNIKSQKRVGKYGVDLTALEEIGVKSIYQALESEALVVVDEIGPMEIASVKFQGAVNEVIQSGLTMVGTIVKRRLPFTDKIKRSCPNIIEVGPHNRELIAGQILQTLEGGQNT